MTQLIILIIVFVLPAFIVLIKNLLSDLYFWQIKEYRWDRFWVHIRWDQTENHKNYWLFGLKFILFAGIFLLFISPLVAIVSIFSIYVIWVFESFNFILDIISGRKVRRPAIKSVRNLLITALFSITFLFIIGLISYPFSIIERGAGSEIVSPSSPGVEPGNYPDIYLLIGMLALLIILIDIASPIVTAVFVQITQPFAILRRRLIVNKARRKLSEMKNLKIVAITGSQGKTTTKEILYSIIKDEDKVAKTPENYNTDVGVAKAILSMSKMTEIFIAEMGTYKTGELRGITQAFKPNVAIITDIDTQHVGLFGSRDKLAKAKFEIIEGMQKEGTAILNLENDIIKKMSESLEVNKIGIMRQGKQDDSSGSNLSLTEFSATKSGWKGVLNYKGFTQKLEINFEGEHLVTNVLLATVAALELGIDIKTIVKKLASLKMSLPRLSEETGDNDTIVLNDTYNSTRKGFIAASKMLSEKAKKGKRIIITNGILELGREKKSIYKSLVKDIKDNFDVLITTDPLLHAVFSGKKMDKKAIFYINNPDLIIMKVREITKPGDAILLEGRIPPSILSTLVSDNH